MSATPALESLDEDIRDHLERETEDKIAVACHPADARRRGRCASSGM